MPVHRWKMRFPLPSHKKTQKNSRAFKKAAIFIGFDPAKLCWLPRRGSIALGACFGFRSCLYIGDTVDMLPIAGLLVEIFCEKVAVNALDRIDRFR